MENNYTFEGKIEPFFDIGSSNFEIKVTENEEGKLSIVAKGSINMLALKSLQKFVSLMLEDLEAKIISQTVNKLIRSEN